MNERLIDWIKAMIIQAKDYLIEGGTWYAQDEDNHKEVVSELEAQRS